MKPTATSKFKAKSYLLFFLMGVSISHGQAVSSITIEVSVRAIADNAYEVRWWGEAGFSYGLESSENLADWIPLPVLEGGFDALIAYAFSTDSSNLFLRVKRFPMPLSQFYGLDSDSDGLTNGVEMTHGLNPFLADTDRDGLPDGYEIGNGMDALTACSACDFDGDGVVDSKDGRPADPSVGLMQITITNPEY